MNQQTLYLELEFLNCKHTAFRETDNDDMQLGDIYYCKECKRFGQVATILIHQVISESPYSTTLRRLSIILNVIK